MGKRKLHGLKPLKWEGRSKDELLKFPREVQRDIGFALYLAQCGDKYPSAKPLKGFRGAGVLEIVENHDRDAYRAVYTVKLEDAVYVFHAFQKKSKKGIQTPRREMKIIEANFKGLMERIKNRENEK